VARAVRELMEANALVRGQDGTYRFNKNYESWTRNDRPRLSPTEVQFCKSAPARAVKRGVKVTLGSGTEPDPKSVINPDNASADTGLSIQITTDPLVINLDNPRVINPDNGLLSD